MVAILASSDLNYAVSIFALTRMGFTLLLLSTRLSTDAYVNLLRLTDCQKIVVGSKFKDTAKEIQEQSPLSNFDIVVKDEYDLEQPSGPRIPYFRPKNAFQQLSFVSPSQENVDVSNTYHVRSSTHQGPPGCPNQFSRHTLPVLRTTPAGSPTGHS